MHPRADERFDFEQLLGEGPAARVWLVRDRANGESRLALKEFREDGLAPRLDRELHDQALLAHPGLAGIYGSIPGHDPRMPRVAREFVDGVRLADHLRGLGGEAARDLFALAAEALRVLDCLAAFDRPHGNLIPDNLLVRKRARAAYRVAVLDGGVLSAAQPGPASFAYLAPERLGGGPPTIAGDVYALGIVLFEALHGRTPYRVRQGDAKAWIATIAAGRRVRPAVPAPLPDSAEGWLEALIQPDPASRPAPREALRTMAGFAGAHLEQETASGTTARLARAVAVVRRDAVRTVWEHLSPSRDPRLVWVCGASVDDRDRLLRGVAAEAAGRGWRVTLASGLPARRAAEIASCAGNASRCERQCRPGLLVLPGFDRADGEAVAALERILRGGGKPPLRVLAGLDPDGIAEPRLRRLLERAGRGPSLRRVDLGPLTESENAALARRCGSTLDATALDALRTRTAGDADRIGAALVAGPEGGELDGAARRLRDELSAHAREWLASDRAAAGDDAEEAVAAGLAVRLGDRRLRSRGRLLRQLSAFEAEAGKPGADVACRGPAVPPPSQRSAIDAGLEALAGDCRDSAPDEAAHLLQRELARTAGDIDAEILARTALATVLLIAGRYGEAITRARQAAEIAARWGDLDSVAEARAVRAMALARCGRITDAGMLLEAGAADERLGLGPAAGEATRLAAIEIGNAGAHDTAGSRVPETLQRDDRPTPAPKPAVSRDAWRRTLELERLALAGDDGFASAYAAFVELARGGTRWSAPCWMLRAELAALRNLIRTASADIVVEAARQLHDRSRDTFPAIAAEAAAAGVETMRAALRPHEARALAAAGRRSLDVAADRIGDGALRAGFLERRAFTPLREGALEAQRRLRALYEMSRALNSESDPEKLLAAILDMAIEVVSAERGMILLRDDRGDLAVRLARNLERRTVADVEEFSRSVAMRAGAGRPTLAVDATIDARTRDLESVSLFGIRSVLCVPLRSRGEIAGVVYLDSRTEGASFSVDDLEFLEAFSDHAALALENARVRRRLELENERLQVIAEARVHFGNIIGESDVMREVFALIEKLASSDLPVLIQGESGTGKELVARAVHFNGERRKKAFVTENCAAAPESLLQSELFGHVRGAFTGADRDRPGLFEQADGGTLFLDEVGDMSAGMQAQLLRALQDGEVRRVGSDRPTRVDVRVIAATHHDLQTAAEAGRFRSDLLYRLQVLSVQVPPLRERGADIALLARHFFARIARDRGWGAPSIDPQLLELLSEYPWPGNVRQLENVLRRLSLLAGDQPPTAELVRRNPWLSRTLVGGPAPAAGPGSLARSERERIRAALQASGGNRARAARMLGISRATIYRKISDLDP